MYIPCRVIRQLCAIKVLDKVITRATIAPLLSLCNHTTIY